MKIFSFPITLLMATIALLLSYPKASAATVDVTVAPNGQLVFSPSSITINPGDTVRWTWAATFHSSTSGIPGMPNGIWDSGILNQGATFTHIFNSTGSSNTGTGYFSLMNNTSGGSNTAAGWEALTANTTGSTNTAIGNQALQSNLSNSDHVAIGSMAGSGITSVDNNIIIGHHSGVHSVFGQESDRCFIDNIFGAPVSAATAAVEMIDSD